MNRFPYHLCPPTNQHNDKQVLTAAHVYVGRNAGNALLPKTLGDLCGS